jgi:hypothetical protein
LKAEAGGDQNNSHEAEQEENALSDTEIKVLTKAVVAEGQQSVAIDQAQVTVINTGVVHGDIINVSTSQSLQDSTLTADNIGAALNLVKLNQSLSSELSKRIAAELESARESFRKGNTNESFQRVRALFTSASWQALDDWLRAMVLRALANMTLSLRGKDGVDEARSFIDDAQRLVPTDTDRSVRVRIKFLQEGAASALDELQDPLTLDEFNLRVGILLETDRIDEALNALASPPAGVEIDSETHRLRAWAFIFSGDLAAAQSAITASLNQTPDRQNVRLAAAIIDYYSSLSPLALQREAIAHPHPLNPTLVKRDEESQQRLKNAATVFADVAGQMESESNSQKEIETWEIACWSNVSDRINEAVDRCRSSLSKDPANFRVLAWVLNRGYEIDLAPSEDALKKLLADAVDEEYRIHYVLALLGIYLRNEAIDSVLNLLDAENKLFESSGNSDLWWYWREQALVIGGKPDVALDELNKIQQQKLRDSIQFLALCAIADRDNEWKPVVEYLEAAWKETEDPQFLIQLCDVKAQLKDWNYVADRAEEYCDRVGTASAAYFAISAARNAGRNQLCLQLLEKYGPLFHGDGLPENLQRLRVYCKLGIKDIAGALTDAERLVHEDDSVENIITLLDVLRVKGDLFNIEAAVKRLRKRELTALQCLQLAMLVRVENPDLAREFWRRAKSEVQNDKSLAPLAVDLAFKLGLDHEIGQLWERIHEVAKSEDETIQLFNMDQVLETMRHRQTAVEKIQELYGNGDAPLSLVAQRVKRPVIDIFNGLAGENSSTPAPKWHMRPRLFIRHGARLLPPSENFQSTREWRLHADITALLLADHLGLLDKIEETFKPLRISAKAPAALLAQRNELLEIQQSRLDDSRTIVSLFDQGKLHCFKSESPTADLEMFEGVFQQQRANDHPPIFSIEESEPIVSNEAASSAPLSIQLGADRITMLAAAYKRDGFAVGLLPLHAYGNTQMEVLEIPSSLRGRVINCRAIVDSLLGQDRLSQQMAEPALSALGQEANPSVSPSTPLLGSKLYLMDGTADVLAGAKILDRACDAFEVAVSESCLLEARTTIEEYDRRSAVAAQAQRLIERLSTGLEDGRYQFVAISDQRLKETADIDDNESIDFAALGDLFRYEAVEWDILWIDDRAINKHPLRENAPIIGINEILIALRERETIDKHEYYDILLKLRAENFRYIPLDEAEILYQLRKASIKDGVVSETKSLGILRRYLASCLLDKEYLQPELTIEGNQNPVGEHAFITHCLVMLTGAIAACWADESATEEIARARADWILDNMYVGLFGVLHLQERNHPGILPFRLLARDLAGLLMKGITIGDPLHPERHSGKREAYFSWLTARVTAARFRSEPRLLSAVTEEIARMFTAFSRAGQQQESQRLVEKLLLQKLFLDFPSDVQTEIELDEQTREWLGVVSFPAVGVGGFSFDLKEFISAVEAALSGARATIKPQGSDSELVFAPIEDADAKAAKLKNYAIGVFNSDNERIAVLGDPTLTVLSSDIEVRKATLREFRDWFDGANADFETEVDHLAALVDPQERLKRVHELQSNSSEVFYASVEHRLRQRELTSENLTPLFAKVLLNGLRLPAHFENDFSQIWEDSAHSLLEAIGVERTIDRCSSIPVNMPQAVIDALNELPADEQSVMLDRLIQVSPSPVAKLHLANLALRITSENGIDQAAKILSNLYDKEAGERDFKAFAAILSFVNEEIEACRDSSEISPQIRLAIAWSHASRVHNIFHSAGFSAEDIAENFQRLTRQINAETMLREPAQWDDSLHPHGLDRTILLTHGASKMFAGIEANKIEETGIIKMIEAEMIVDVNGTEIPKLSLLHDSTLENNALNSMLGGDHSEALKSVIQNEQIDLLSSNKLKEVVKESLDKLVVDPNAPAWASIIAVVGDLPIYTDLRTTFRAAVDRIEIDEAFMWESEIAHIALSAAANQVRHWGDEGFRSQVKSKILAAISFELEKESVQIDQQDAADHNNQEKRIVNLIDSALKLCIVPGDLQATGRNLADILERIAESWKGFSKRFDPVISAFLWELPVEVVVSWWPLCLKLRATMEVSW